ncbi:hypothetical protein ABTZ46_18235 [Nocardioides sp. NPDC126508]
MIELVEITEPPVVEPVETTRDADETPLVELVETTRTAARN